MTEKGVLVVFDQGASIKLTATKDIMSILFLGPQAFKNNTSGLLGTWNDNPDDDFIFPDGVTLLPPDSTTLDLHAFGQSCKYIFQHPQTQTFYQKLQTLPNSLIYTKGFDP